MPQVSQTRRQLIRLAGLALGLMIGLSLAFLAARLSGRLAEPEQMQGVSLHAEAPIGALGPLELDWPAELAVPLPSDFVVDDQIGVELTTDLESLLLTPEQPLAPGGHSLRYQPAEGDLEQWDFQVRPPEALYLKEAAGLRSLYRWQDGTPLLLSGEHLVTDYEPSRQGDVIAYAASNSEAGTTIWLVDRQGRERSPLVDCGPDRCDQLNWAPSGDRLAFSRSDPEEDGQPRIWTIGLEDRTAAPLFQQEDRLGTDPSWSPNGRYLAFYDPAVNGVRLLDIDTVREDVVPNRTGVSGSWSADSQQLYLPLLVFLGEEPATHLYQLDVEGRELRQLLGERGGWRQVGEPALGLQGQWMALAALRGSPGAGLGLYLFNLEDQRVQALAEDPRFSYGGPSWDPYGEQLLFQRFPLSQNQASPDLLLWQVDQAEPELLIEAAGSAAWLH